MEPTRNRFFSAPLSFKEQALQKLHLEEEDVEKVRSMARSKNFLGRFQAFDNAVLSKSWNLAAVSRIYQNTEDRSDMTKEVFLKTYPQLIEQYPYHSPRSEGNLLTEFIKYSLALKEMSPKYLDKEELLAHALTHPLMKREVSAEEAETLLAKQPEGTWILRYSARFNKPVIAFHAGKGEIRQLLVHNMKPEEMEAYPLDKNLFDTLSPGADLINHPLMQKDIASSEDAEKILRGNPPGAWLLRYNSKEREARIAYVDSQGEVKHMGIGQGFKGVKLEDFPIHKNIFI